MNDSVGVVIVNYHNYWDTIDCISNHLLRQQGVDLNIVIVDNASTNDSAHILNSTFEGMKNVQVIVSRKNVGYAAGNNIGIRHLIKSRECSYIVVANNDISFDDPALIKKMAHRYNTLDQVAFVAPMMANNSRISRNSAWRLPTAMSETLSSTYCLTVLFRRYLNRFSYELSEHESPEIPVDCIAGSFFMGTVEAFEKIGYFDEGTFLYYEETILGRKVKEAHLSNYLVNDLVYNHRVANSINSKYSTSRKYAIRLESKLYYWKKYRNKGIFFVTLLRVLHCCNIIEIGILDFCKKLSGFVSNSR